MGKTYINDWSINPKEKKPFAMRMPASEQARMGSTTRGSGPFGSAMIEYKNMKFLIMDRPSNATISKVVEELKKHEAHDLVRVCEPTYSTDLLENEGINVLDWYYDDGAPPPKQIIDEWLKLVKKRFKEYPGSCVAVHCVAGLGRAPMLVALALIESGMKYEDAVEFIRKKRRGAINAKQLSYLETYKASKKLKEKEGSCCIQ